MSFGVLILGFLLLLGGLVYFFVTMPVHFIVVGVILAIGITILRSVRTVPFQGTHIEPSRNSHVGQ